MPSPRAYPRLHREATDPTTPPGRLDKFTRHLSITVRRWATANPNLPEGRLRELMGHGHPAAWDNPAAPLVLLTVPREEAEGGARACARELARLRSRESTFGAEDTPYPVSDRMRALLHPLLLSAWEDPRPSRLLIPTSHHARNCGLLSREHHTVTLLVCLAVRAVLAERPDHGWSTWQTDRMIDEAEAFARSGETDPLRAGAWLDRFAWMASSIAYQALLHAAICHGDWMYRMGDGSNGRNLDDLPGVADLIRAALPVPLWMQEVAPG
jgi:hypothetical protein